MSQIMSNKKPESSIRLMLEIGMPQPSEAPAPEKKPEIPQESVEDKVRAAIDCIDSGHDSRVEWMMLNRLYKDLKALKKPNSRAKNLINMIEPMLAKYGYYEVPANQYNGN